GRCQAIPALRFCPLLRGTAVQKTFARSVVRASRATQGQGSRIWQIGPAGVRGTLDLHRIGRGTPAQRTEQNPAQIKMRFARVSAAWDGEQFAPHRRLALIFSSAAEPGHSSFSESALSGASTVLRW